MIRIRLFISLNLLFFFLLCFAFIQKVYAIDITNSWDLTSSLPQTRASSTAVGYNGKLYIFGGANTDDFSSFLASEQNANGTLIGWSYMGELPDSRYWTAQVQKGSRIYILGGAMFDGGENYKNTVFSAEVLSDGSIPGWQAFNPLPVSLVMGAGAIVNDRIYYAGGFNSNGYNKKIYSAPINADGSLGNWSEVGELPEARIGLGMIEHNGNLLIFGGDVGISISNTVYKATPDSNGNISSWQQLKSLPRGVYRGGWVKINNTILSIGGYDGLGSTDKIYYTTVSNDGTIDDWSESANHLPSTIHGGAAAIVNDYLYYIGGYRTQSGSYQSSVFFTKLNLETNLNVPLLKQTDSLWGSQIYDSANIWSPNYTGINRWGCALTSGAMIFNYHGLTKLPDGSNLNPGTLNTWLKSQPDGYVGSGWVNWLALSRLSKLAKSKNPLFKFDALQYQKIGGNNHLQLTQDLKKNIPDILEVPGHFVVAKGTLGSSFSINDPYYSRNSLEDYSNSFLSLGRYLPSNTDLSYLMFLVNKQINIKVKDGNGNIVGESYLQQPLNEDEGSSTSGEAMNFYYVPVPETGDYSIELYTDNTFGGKYTLQSFIYDVNGGVKKIANIGVAHEALSPEVYTLKFDKQNNSSANLSEVVYVNNLSLDLYYFFQNNQVTNLGVFYSLYEKLNRVNSYMYQDKKKAAGILKSFITQLDSNKNKTIKLEAYNILKPQAVALLSLIK